MKPTSKWKLNQQVATGSLDALYARVDTANPGQGAVLEQAGDGTLVARLFQIGGESERESGSFESYCRGNDLITRYAATDKDPIAFEVYWRSDALADHEAADDFDDDAEDDSDDDMTCVALETIYSLQTDLLDSSPQPVVPSTFLNAELRWFRGELGDEEDEESNASAWRECSWDEAFADAADDQVAVACIVHFACGQTILQTVIPVDLRSVEISTEGEETEILWHLKSEFLEKGVIRRLRMVTVVANGDSEDKDLLQMADQFYGSELPLTV